MDFEKPLVNSLKSSTYTTQVWLMQFIQRWMLTCKRNDHLFQQPDFKFDMKFLGANIRYLPGVEKMIDVSVISFWSLFPCFLQLLLGPSSFM